MKTLEASNIIRAVEVLDLLVLQCV